MSNVLAKVKNYEITEEMLNETVEALRTQQNINITSEEQKQDLSNMFIENNNGSITQMSTADIIDLFK